MTAETRRRTGGNVTNDVRNASRPTSVAKEDIVRRAYEIYERRGCQPGRELDDWLQAEQEVSQRRFHHFG